jgi:hypothetical protein
MHLRVGGSASNGVIYVPNGTPGRGSGGTVVTDASLAALNDFARRANMRITFCFQHQTLRNGRWDPANATALWAMVTAKGLTAFLGWSLGNEIIGSLNNRTAYALDYVDFRAAVTAHAPSWAQDIVGPSAAGFPGDDVIAPFLEATAALPNMSISIHAYSFGTCK